jgi:hypothetical protein
MVSSRLIAVLVVAGAFVALMETSPGGDRVRGEPVGGRPGVPATSSSAIVPMLAFSARPRGGGPVQAFIVGGDGRVRQLTHAPQSVDVRGWFSDGSWLIGRSTIGGEELLIAIDPGSGAIRPLWRGRSRIGDIVTAPSGHAVALSAGRRLMLLASPESRVVRLSTRYAGHGHDGGTPPSASFSADGRHLAYSRTAGTTTQLVVREAAGGSTVVPTGAVQCRSAGRRACSRDTQPAWQPTSTRLVYVRLRGNGSSLRWVMLANGKAGVYRLEEPVRSQLGAPTWSPDGTRLAFTSESGLYTMNADGSQLHRVAATPPAGVPAWSPDSSRIAYASRTSYSGSRERIAVLGIDGSRPFRTDVSALHGVIVGPILWQPTYSGA